MEKRAKTSGIILEDLAKRLPIDPSRKVDTEVKITKNWSEWHTTDWGHCATQKDLHRGSWKLGKVLELITSNDGNIRAVKVLLSTKNVVNRPPNLLYPLECQHELRQMPREMPKTEQADLNIKETEKIKNSQSFRAKNVNPTIKTTQNLTLKETEGRLHEKLKIEYSDKIQWIIETLLVAGMSRICKNFCFAYVMKHCPKDISRTIMNKVLYKNLCNRIIRPLSLLIIGNF